MENAKFRDQGQKTLPPIPTGIQNTEEGIKSAQTSGPFLATPAAVLLQKLDHLCETFHGTGIVRRVTIGEGVIQRRPALFVCLVYIGAEFKPGLNELATTVAPTDDVKPSKSPVSHQRPD